MNNISTMKEFKQALESLTLEQQRLVGARFVADVLDLTENNIVKQAAEVAANPDATPEELMSAYHSSKHVAVKSGIHGDWDLIDWQRQTTHFVAQACATSLAPYHPGVRWRHLAWNVAEYCRMARTCASIAHDEEPANLSETEQALNKQIQKQFEIVTDFLLHK